jgi:beta-glucuronidase
MLYPQSNPRRSALRLDGLWHFQPEHPGTDVSQWPLGLPSPRHLAVPGSWNEQCADLFRFFGPGWYSLAVTVPTDWAGRALWVRVGAAHYRSQVWLNGVLLGGYEGGSLPAEYEATAAARPGAENLLVVRVDGSLDPWGLPPALEEAGEGRIGFHNTNPPVTYDFFPYAGLHRSVWLYATAPNRIEDLLVTSLLQEEGSAEVRVRVRVANPSAVETLTARIETREIPLTRESEGGEFTGTLRLAQARLWDIGRPELYQVEAILRNRDGSEDSYLETFGIRSVQIDAEGLLLNGRRVFLQGFGKHEDSDAFGRGLNLPLMVRDFELMRWIGANSFRTSHYPYAEEILDYADRQGVLVIAETPFVGMNDRMFTPAVRAKALPMIERMIARDKNHPSVIAWSLANEPYVSTDAAEDFFRAMADTARQCDPTRPITYVAHMEVEDNRAAPYYDFFCINKYYGWYIGHGEIDGTLPGFEECLEGFHKAFGKPMIVAEFGADAVSGMHSWPPQPFSEEYQAETIEKQYLAARSKPWVFGTHVWNFADFKTGSSLTRIIHNRKGVFTRERTPKLAAHVLRRLWTGTNQVV